MGIPWLEESKRHAEEMVKTYRSIGSDGMALFAERHLALIAIAEAAQDWAYWKIPEGAQQLAIHEAVDAAERVE